MGGRTRRRIHINIIYCNGPFGDGDLAAARRNGNGLQSRGIYFAHGNADIVIADGRIPGHLKGKLP